MSAIQSPEPDARAPVVVDQQLGAANQNDGLRMPRSLLETDWTVLLKRIAKGACTPFLGAGASFGALPLGAALANDWATEFEYPLEDSSDLIRVAQYVAIQVEDPMYPKEELCDRFKKVAPPDFRSAGEPHGFMADLPLPIYITTNYDDFMVKALRDRGKEPRQEISRWNSRLFGIPSVLNNSDYVPRPETPLVFHLHGHASVPDSLVLTEDDYLDFLVAIAKEKDNVLPPRIQEAMTGTSILFIGYRIADWNFRVLFRSVNYLEQAIQRKHVSVQILPVGDTIADEQRRKALGYLDQYYDKLKTRMYWGTSREFMAELKQRWERRAP